MLRWGCSRFALRRLEQKGLLNPTKRARERVARYSTAEVEAIEQFGLEPRARFKRDDEGGLAAAAFRLFDRGLSLRDIVIKLRIPPARVDELYAAYLDDDLEQRHYRLRRERMDRALAVGSSE